LWDIEILKTDLNPNATIQYIDIPNLTPLQFSRDFDEPKSSIEPEQFTSSPFSTTPGSALNTSESSSAATLSESSSQTQQLSSNRSLELEIPDPAEVLRRAVASPGPYPLPTNSKSQPPSSPIPELDRTDASVFPP
jgi:hypothetical protein